MVANNEVVKAGHPTWMRIRFWGTINLRTLTASGRPQPLFFGMFEGTENNRQIPFGDKQPPSEVDMTAGKRFG